MKLQTLPEAILPSLPVPLLGHIIAFEVKLLERVTYKSRIVIRVIKTSSLIFESHFLIFSRLHGGSTFAFTHSLFHSLDHRRKSWRSCWCEGCSKCSINGWN